MSITENLLADFLTQEEAAAELKICERMSGQQSSLKFVKSSPSHASTSVKKVAGINSRRQMSITANLLADFLTQKEAAGELKVCERTLDRWRRLGEGPPIIKLGRRILYRRSSLLEWLRGQEHHARPGF
jgi:hypothetical protein